MTLTAGTRLSLPEADSAQPATGSRPEAGSAQLATGARRDVPVRMRDRYIDFLHALALIWIMTYHLFGLAWMPILFPSMGIMFGLAGSLMASSLDRSAGNPWRVLKKRGIRLLPPVWLMGLIVVPVMLVAGWRHSETAGVPLSWQTMVFWVVPISDPPGSALGDDWVTPLWYIRTYLWFLLLSPAALWLFRHWPKRMLALPVGVVLLAAVGLVPLSGRGGDVMLSIAMFGGCWMLGFAHHDNRIRVEPLVKVLLGGGSLMGLGLAWAFTHPDPVSAYDIGNVPMANTLYCLGAVLILLRLHPDLSWMDRHSVVEKIVTVINSRAMTIYLWGNFAIFLSGSLLDSWTITADRDTRSGPLGPILMYLVSWLILVCFVVLFGWCEDLAARRPVRINPWPGSKRQFDLMRTRRALASPRPAWMADLTPRRLFVVTSGLIVVAAALSAAALAGTHTPGRTVIADTPSRFAVQPRTDTKPPDNLGKGTNKAVVTRPAPATKQTASASSTVPLARWTTAPKSLTGVTAPNRVPNVAVPGPVVPAPVPTKVPTVPKPTPTVPKPTPTVPKPTPTAPSPTPTAPDPTPTAPDPTPTAPDPTSTPDPVPTA